jgi:TRAP-type C4-dicarboxylate transport system permease small subunit
MKKLETLNRILRINGRVSNSTGVIAGILSLCLTFWITADVILRYVFSKPIPGANEISRIALAWIFFFGMVYAYNQGAHVKVNLFTSRIPNYQSLLEVICGVIEILTFGFVAYVSWWTFSESWAKGEIFSAPVAIPYWLAKFAAPVGLAIFSVGVCLYTIIVISDIRKKRSKTPRHNS